MEPWSPDRWVGESGLSSVFSIPADWVPFSRSRTLSIRRDARPVMPFRNAFLAHLFYTEALKAPVPNVAMEERKSEPGKLFHSQAPAFSVFPIYATIGAEQPEVDRKMPEVDTRNPASFLVLIG